MGRSTIAMVLLFAVLAGGVYLFQTKNPAQPEGATVYVMEIDEGSVNRIDLVTPTGAVAFERLEPFGWKFASGDPAAFERVSSVVNRLSKLRSQAKVLDQVADRAQYKLDAPRVTATLTMKDGSTHRILFGAETVNNAANYALNEDTGQLHTVSTLVVSDAQKLVADPPIPTPTPGGPTSVPTAAPTITNVTPTPSADATATPTIGLPAPVVP